MISHIKPAEIDKRVAPIVLLIPSLKGGGAERVIISLANDLNTKGYKVTLASINCEIPAYPIQKGIKVVYLVKRVSDSIFHRIYYAAQVFYKLISLLINTKPVCMISFITSANIFTGMACWVTNTTYIVSERTSPNRTINGFNFLQKWVVEIVYGRAKAVVVGSLGGERCLLESKSFKSLVNIQRIPNSVTKFNDVTNHPVHSKKFILGVGRLCFVKGFDILISAFQKASIDELDLIIVGEGVERQQLNKLINDLDLSKRVFLVGSKTNLQDYYTQAEIFVLPSRNEGYPNALLEAMSFGCPCIASNCEFGPAEILNDGESGLLVIKENPEALAANIVKMHRDQELRAKFSINCRLIKSTNDPSRIFKRWEDLAISS